MNAPDYCARILVCRCSNRAGIQDNNIGISGLCRCKALLHELTFNGRSVRLCRTAAKVFNIKARHGVIIASNLGSGSEAICAAHHMLLLTTNAAERSITPKS